MQITPNFPGHCRHVLEALGEFYYQNRLARERGLSRIEWLHLHQWFEAQLNDRKVQSNSGSGKAIGYMLRHWQALTRAGVNQAHI